MLLNFKKKIFKNGEKFQTPSIYHVRSFYKKNPWTPLFEHNISLEANKYFSSQFKTLSWPTVNVNELMNFIT